MKKTIALLVIFFLFFIGFLSGCTSEEGNFVGTWEVHSETESNQIWTFHSDGTVTSNAGDEVVNYVVDGNRLILTHPWGNAYYTYTFSNNGNTVKLINEETDEGPTLYKIG